MTIIGRRPWAFALLYVGLSLAVEILLIVVVGWRVPEDNARIAPILLTVPPSLAAILSGYRRTPGMVLMVALLAAALTLVITLSVNRLTGINTGLLEPIINRSVAGWLAAALTNRLTPDRALSTATGTNPEGSA